MNKGSEIFSASAGVFNLIYKDKNTTEFTETEVQLLGEQFGFSILDAREFMTDREPSRDTWGVWFSLQKV
jgi:hypothetical protein